MEKLAQPLHLFLEKSGFQGKLEKHHYLQIWPEVAGKKIERYTRPVKVERDKLVVEVSDSTWFYHLTLLKPKIIEDFNKKAQATIIRDIKFINADFLSLQQEKRKNLRPERKPGSFAGVNQQIKGIRLEKEETKKIEEVVRAAPDFLQTSLRKLCNNHYRQQAYNKKKGAKQCQRCRGLSFHLEEGLCSFCQKDLLAWRGVLDYFFEQTPWGTYTVLQREHPLLDEEAFKIYKNRLLSGYRRQLAAVLENEFADDAQKEKIKAVVYSFVLLSTAKEPAKIQKEDIFDGLKGLPGLYRMLYG